MSKSFSSAVAERRTVYALSKESTVSDERIRELVEEAVKHAPSAFNSQSGRVVVLLGKEHDKLWDITKEALRKVVPADQFAPTEQKIDAFKAGYGTVLFYEDYGIVEYLQQAFAAYKDNFPVWSHQSSGMLQFVVWTALGIEGLGASLQHYNELIDSDVKNQWNIPANWKLIGQMPFGKPAAQPDAKQQNSPVADRVKVYK